MAATVIDQIFGVDQCIIRFMAFEQLYIFGDPERSDRNSFEDLCVLASKEQWCWNIMCTTCGHMHFRYAFRELAKGVYPDNSDWIISKDRPGLGRLLGELPISLEIEEQEKLGSILGKASLKRIAAACIFPDWLGYLGLGLAYTESSMKAGEVITKSWVPQFQGMVQSNENARAMLQRIISDRHGRLNWRDLEVLQAEIIQSKGV